MLNTNYSQSNQIAVKNLNLANESLCVELKRSSSSGGARCHVNGNGSKRMLSPLTFQNTWEAYYYYYTFTYAPLLLL